MVEIPRPADHTGTSPEAGPSSRSGGGRSLRPHAAATLDRVSPRDSLGSTEIVSTRCAADGRRCPGRGGQGHRPVTDCRTQPSPPSPVPNPVRQPTLIEGRLRVFYPVPGRWACPVQGCDTTYRNKMWTTNRVSLANHLKRKHQIDPVYELVCGRCEMTLGKKPSTHECNYEEIHETERKQPVMTDDIIFFFPPPATVQ